MNFSDLNDVISSQCNNHIVLCELPTKSILKLSQISDLPALSCWFIIIICISFLLYYVLRFCYIKNEIKKAIKFCKKIKNKEFKYGWDDLCEEIDKIKVLNNSWSQLKKSIHNDPVVDEKIISLHYPDEFINEESIYYRNFNTGLIRSIPGILTGLGLLFTFIGLANGITIAFEAINDTGSAELAKASLPLSKIEDTLTTLLNGAGVAFNSSVCGIGLAIVFNFLIKICHNSLLRNISTFNNAIEARLTIENEEEIQYKAFQIQAKLLEKSQSQERILSGLIEEFANNFKEWFKDILTKQNDLAKEHIETVVKCITEIRDKIQNMSDHQVEQIDTLLDNSVKELSKAISKELTSLSEGLSESARNISLASIDFNNSFDKINHKISEVVVETDLHIDAIKKTFDDIEHNLEEKFNNINDKIDESVAHTEEHINAIDSTFKNINDNLTENFDSLNNKINAIISQTESHIEAVKSTFEGIESSLESTIKSILNTITDSQNAITDLSKEFVSNGNNFVDGIKDSTEQISNIIEGSVDRFTSVQTTIKEILDKLKDTSEELNSSIKNSRILIAAMLKFRDGINDAFKKTIDSASLQQASAQSIGDMFTNKLNKVLDSVIAQSNALQKQQEGILSTQQKLLDDSKEIQNLTTNHFENIRTEMASVHDTLQSNLQTADHELANAVNSMSAGLQNWINSQKELSSSLKGDAKFIINSTQKFRDDLQNSVTELSGALKTISETSSQKKIQNAQ